jgi:hypothetical protein
VESHRRVTDVSILIAILSKMSVNNNIVSTPISTTDVGNLIGVSSHDVGTLCKASSINKWSRHKPVVRASVIKTTDTQFSALHFGLNFPTADAASDVRAAMVAGAWSYNKPTGGASSPYRLGDFDGYKHTAISPFTTFTSDIRSAVTGETITFTISVNKTKPDDYSIGVGDMLTSGYLGVAVFSSTGTYVGYVTGSHDLSSLTTYSDTCSMPTTALSTGTYYAYAIHATTAQTAWSTGDGDLIIPLPFAESHTSVDDNADYVKISVIDVNSTIEGVATVYKRATTGITHENEYNVIFRIYNNSLEDMTITPVSFADTKTYIYVHTGEGNTDYLVNTSNITIAANSYVDVKLPASGYNPDDSGEVGGTSGGTIYNEIGTAYAVLQFKIVGRSTEFGKTVYFVRGN